MHNCIVAAASYQRLNPQILWAIANVETGFRTIYNRSNDNGSYDIGIMQINSSWLPKLARHGISEQSLLEPCTNIYIGAWILAANIATHGYTWKAVGAYNARTPSKQRVYVAKVMNALAAGQRTAAQRPQPSPRPLPIQPQQQLALTTANLISPTQPDPLD